MPNNRSEAALRERLKLAEKATQGPWYHTLAAIVGTKKSPEDNDATCICFTEWGCSGDPQANAAHIAASSPDVVRADIEEILRLRAEVKRLEDMLAHLVSRSVCQTVEGWWSAHGETFQTKKDAMQHVITKAEDEMKEAARKAVDRTTRRTAQHRLYALIRERYGCKYSCLPADRWKEVAIWLVEGPLTSGGEMAI